MISKTHLSIQDYFRASGIGRHPTPDRTTASVPTAANSGDFSSLLDNLQAATRNNGDIPAGGMNISDYRQRAVPCQVSAISRPGPAEKAAQQAFQDAEARPVQLPGSDPGPFDPIEQPASPGTAAPAAPPSEDDRIQASIRAAAARYNLPANIIHSVIRAESNFEPQAVSRAGAQGLMQLMPATAEELGVDDPFDIEQNIDGGARYLRRMLDQFGGDVRQALAAYNAGPGTVMRYNGNVPYAETRNYVQKVLHFSRQYRV